MTDLARPAVFQGVTYTTREAFAAALAEWAASHPPEHPPRVLVHVAGWQLDGRAFSFDVMVDALAAGWAHALAWPFDDEENNWRLAHPGEIALLRVPEAT